jgi:hypothetical protein
MEARQKEVLKKASLMARSPTYHPAFSHPSHHHCITSVRFRISKKLPLEPRHRLYIQGLEMLLSIADLKRPRHAVAHDLGFCSSVVW